MHGFWSCWSTADLLTVVFGKIARVFISSGDTRALTLDICKAFDRVLHAGLLHKLKFYGVSGWLIGLILFFLSNGMLWVVLDENCLQEYTVNAGVHEGFIFRTAFFLLYIKDQPDDVISNIASMLMILLSALSVIWRLKCGSNWRWVLKLNMTYVTL